MASAQQKQATAKTPSAAQDTAQGAVQGATDKAAPKTYTALVVINHDDETYDIGSPIDLTDKQAQPLLAVNAIQALDTAAE